MIKNTENNNGKVVVLFEVTPTAEGKYAISNLPPN